MHLSKWAVDGLFHISDDLRVHVVPELLREGNFEVSELLSLPKCYDLWRRDLLDVRGG